jgi:hypothetical protein
VLAALDKFDSILGIFYEVMRAPRSASVHATPATPATWQRLHAFVAAPVCYSNRWYACHCVLVMPAACGHGRAGAGARGTNS